MKIKLFVHRNDLNTFYNFYEVVNRDKQIEKNQFPLLDIKEFVSTEEAKNYVELFIYYDIYKAMKYVYIDKISSLKKEKEEDKTSTTMNIVNEKLTNAGRYGLLTEVVYSAIKAALENSKLTIEDALINGMNEWDI